MGNKIYINPGHSDVDPGAVGYETERKLNVKVSDFMNEHLLANYDCQTRMNPGSVNSTAQVAADANEWGADLLVSNHFNAGGGDGYEALVHSSARVELGKIFEKHVLAAGQNSRGVKLRPELSILRRTRMPAVLNEGAFVDNKTDIDDWNEDAELKKLGVAYAEAAAEYLDLPRKNSVSVKPAEPIKPVEPTEPEKVGVLYRVQVGAYSQKSGAEGMRQKLNAAGFSGIIVESAK